MTISIQCPHCQKPYKVPEECAGRQATCQNCKKPFKVPAAPQPAGVAAAVSAPTKPAPPPAAPKAPAAPAPAATRPAPPPPAPRPAPPPALPAAKAAPAAPAASKSAPPPAPMSKPAVPPPAAATARPAPPPPKPPAPAPRPAPPAAADAPKPAPAPAKPSPAAAPAAEPAGQTIEFTCTYCDAVNKVGLELEGKQTPCVECKRIVKVPLQVKAAPKDWRKPDTRLPAGARRDTDAAPEGAWGSGGGVSTVSARVLEEAGALPEFREPATVGQWIKRGCYVALVVLVVGGGWLWFRSNSDLRQRDNAVEKVLDFTRPSQTFNAEAASEINRALAELCWKAKDPTAAFKQYRDARGTLPDGERATAEREMLLIEIALGLAELGGDKEQVKEKTHLPKGDVYTEIRRTLEVFRSPDARAEGIRLLADRLIARKVNPDIEMSPLWQKVPEGERPDAMALVGLQLWRAGQAKEAEAAAEGAQKQFEMETKKAASERRPGPAVPALVTLWLLLGKPDKVEAIKPAPGDDHAQFGFTFGNVEAQARQGQLDGLRTWVKSIAGPDQARFAALIAIAALEKNPPDPADLETVAGLLEGPLKGQPLNAQPPDGKPDTNWLLWRLVRAATKAGQDATARRIADAIPDPALRGRAQLVVLQSKLAKSNGKVDEATANDVSAELPAHGLAREAVARHNARAGGLSLRGVDAWTPEFVKPFGYAGLALGMQDRQP